MSGLFKLNGVDYMGGGGGNAKEEIISYAQYLALSEEQRNNGTTYYVNDINGDGEDFQPIIYSTDERKVGVWIDGKPLYQKTKTYLNISSATGASLDTIANIADNIDILFIKDSMTEVGSGTYFVNGNYYDGSSWRCQLLKTDNDILYYASWGDGSFNFTVTYLYTKTTDTPGSGTWTPQGVPAQHYSTNEQVVGTWVDGSTLYQKTISIPTGSITGGQFHTLCDVSNLNLHSVVAYLIEDGSFYVLPNAGVYLRTRNNELTLYCVTGSSWNISGGYAILQYTKTSS